jgi:5-methylcytosine-specific restriction protein B
MADFARVLRDDLIPLLEEYCYDDFEMLKDILGSALVDVDAGRIRDEMFLANREEELIQAISFEQLEPLVLAERSDDGVVETPDGLVDDYGGSDAQDSES